MGYNNHNNGNYGNNNYNNNNYNNGNGYNNNGNNNAPPSKKSGVVYSKIKQGKFEGATIVNAWNKSKSKGLITAKVAPYYKSEVIVTSEKGHEYMKMICELTYQKTGQTRLIHCLYNMKTQKIVLSDIGMMISPNGSGTTSSGKRVSGYFGTMFKR